MTLEEYHARQAANGAANQVSRTQAEQSMSRNAVRAALCHVQKAMELLGGTATAEVQAELQRAVEKLRTVL